MQSLIFWRNWINEYRWIWYGALGVFLFSIAFLWFSYIKGVDGVIHWDTLQEQKIIETTVHQFQLGPFELNVPAESYVIFEYFNGSSVVPNTTASYIFLSVLIISSIILLTVITTLQRFWYFIAMGLFILFVVSLRLEVLGLAGQYNRIPVLITVILFIVPSFYFNRFSTSINFLNRLLVFAGVTIGLIVVVALFSDVEYPMYHLTLTGYTPGLILSVLFIIMIAHEVFASFIYIVSQGSTKTLRHLSIISAIYMANLLITSLHETGYLDWNFVYINLYLLLTVSAVLGIWGFREREPLYENIISHSPFGAYWFVALGAICFATTGQLLGNANDPALKIIRHAIIYSHTGYGIVFLTYVLSNFVLMLARNIPIHKVLYKPNRMPYFTYRFAGTLAMLAFVFVSNWHTYVYHGMAGFYNSAGDMYLLLGDKDYAESFYEQARSHAFNNHRSNYALGDMRAKRFDVEGAREGFDMANAKQPSVYSLTNTGNTFLWEADYFGAIKSLQQSNKQRPNSGTLENNIGYAFAKIHNLDSAAYYLNAARQNATSKDAAETNFFAMMASELIPIKTDSVLGLFHSPSAGTLANAMALASLHHDSLTIPIHPLEVKNLTLHSATLLNNYIVHYAKTLDTAFVANAYRLASDSLNASFSEALKASIAHVYYHQGNVARALELLAEQVYFSQAYQGKFNYIMGLWALEQGSPIAASDYFTYANTYDYKDAKFYNAIALTEARRIPEALIAWDTVQIIGSEGEQVVATRLKKILLLDRQQALALADAEKYQYCRYRIGLRDSLELNRLINSFENVNYKAQALLDISKRYYQAGLFTPAILHFNRIGGLKLTNQKLFDDVRHFELRMLAARKEVRAIAKQINNGVKFDNAHRLEKLLYTALLSEMNGDTLTARKHYEVLGVYNPYFEDGILAAADFFRKQQEKSLKPYTILSEAIQVNATSYRLLKAYAAEADRRGFDEYAESARQRITEIE